MSEIITDKLTGKTSAGDVTITSEGGSATMQLQQGVAKAWTLDETLYSNSVFVPDSFNIASTTDVSTGNLYVTFTNVFSANNYCSTGSCAGFSANDNVTTRYSDSSTSNDDIINYDGAYKDASISYVAFGDLA